MNTSISITSSEFDEFDQDTSSDHVHSPPLSSTDIKRLFFLWFNSVSIDGVHVNLQQFSTVLHDIFTSSISTFTDADISNLFNKLCSDKNSLNFHHCLSVDSVAFSNLIGDLLYNDSNAVSVLLNVPQKCCDDNPNRNTVHQMIADQLQEIQSLRATKGRQILLKKQLTTMEIQQSHWDNERRLIEQENESLQIDKNQISESLQILNRNFSDTAELNVHHVKSLKTVQSHNEQLMAELEQANCAVLNQKLQTKQCQKQIQELTVSNQQLRLSNEALIQNNHKQQQKIQSITEMKQQMEIAMECTAKELENKNHEINELKQEVEALRMRQHIAGVSGTKRSRGMTTMDMPMSIKVRARSRPKRKSYIYKIRGRTPTIGGAGDFDLFHDHSLAALSEIEHNAEHNAFHEIVSNAMLTRVSSNCSSASHASHASTPIGASYHQRRESIISVGDGPTFYNYCGSTVSGADSAEWDDNHSNASILYSDKEKGVDVYVYEHNDDGNDDDGGDHGTHDEDVKNSLDEQPISDETLPASPVPKQEKYDNEGQNSGSFDDESPLLMTNSSPKNTKKKKKKKKKKKREASIGNDMQCILFGVNCW